MVVGDTARGVRPQGRAPAPADGAVDELLAAPWNARTAVHEYGGGAWWVRGGVLWFADWATQRLHRLGDDGVAAALTPEPSVPRGVRYADGDVSPDGSVVLCVQEQHAAAGEVHNTIVRLDAAAPSTPEVVVEGPDFVSSPRWRPDGAAYCWLEWDHPDMPWDATRLVVDAGGRRTVVAGGDVRESVVQPAWAPDGSLWFSGDRTGFWSLYRWTPEDGTETMVDLGRDIGFPRGCSARPASPSSTAARSPSSTSRTVSTASACAWPTGRSSRWTRRSPSSTV